MAALAAAFWSPRPARRADRGALGAGVFGLGTAIGGYAVAAILSGLGGTLGASLTDAAAHAFEAGVGVTALIGAGLVVVAAVIAATTLSRGSSAPRP